MVLDKHSGYIEKDGTPVYLAGITCRLCRNDFYVPVIPENEPTYCPYCGGKFDSFVTKQAMKDAIEKAGE